MSIVFKHKGPSAYTSNVQGRAIDGVESWATVALPYNYSKNLPDFMMFEVGAYIPTATGAPGNTVQPGVTRFPAYKLRNVGGGASINGIASTDPHSVIWAVSGIFPRYAPLGLPNAANSSYGDSRSLRNDANGTYLVSSVNNSNMVTPPLRGLIGDLVYPTVTDLQVVTNLGLPCPADENSILTYTLPRGPWSFVETAWQGGRSYILQYEVSASDWVGAADYPVSIASERTNLKYLLPESKLDPEKVIVEVIEENAIRKVVRVRAKRPKGGFNIWSYYYLYLNSDIVQFSTRFHWSDRLGARETHPTITGNYNPQIKRVHQVIGAADYAFFCINRPATVPPKIYGSLDPNDTENPAYTEYETLRDANIANPEYVPLDPAHNGPFRFGMKFYGDFEVGASFYWGIKNTGATPTTTFPGTIKTSYKVPYDKYITEGAGHYWYGVIWNDIIPSLTEKVWAQELANYGLPEGTYIWAKGNC